MKIVPVLLILAAAPAGARVVDRIAAIVDDQVITTSEVDDRATSLRQQGATRGDLRRQALESLIGDKLFARQLADLNVEITDSELSVALDDVRKQNGFASEEQLKQAVERQGLSWSEYRETMREQLAHMKLINLKVRSRVKISEDEVKRRYAELTAGEKDEREVRASHILVAVAPDAAPAQVEAARRKADDLAKRARTPGTDFSALARSSSDGPSKDNGGDLGWFRKGEMVPELEKVAFSLQSGDISDPLRTRFGWHVVKVEETRAVQPRPLAEVADQIRDRLYREELEKQTDAYIKELREAALIEYKVAELAPEKG